MASRAWQEALKRLTEDPAYVIWHKARSRSAKAVLADVAAEEALGADSAQQARSA